MIFIAHRINTIEELKQVPIQYGVEIDVRDDSKGLVLSHDPFFSGELFEEYLDKFNHKFIVVNVKSSGLEQHIINAMKRHNIKDFFILDSNMSSIVEYSKEKEKFFAGRLSEYEAIETLDLSSNLYKWVWLDSFTKLSINKNQYHHIKQQLNMKICLTAPDLLGRSEDIEAFSNQITDEQLYPDAICTKLHNIERWQNSLNK